MQNEKLSKAQQFKRLLFVNVNKYQQQILLPALIICLISCAGVFYTLYYINSVDKNLSVLCHIDVTQLTKDVPSFMRMHSFNKVVPWILFSMTTVLLGIICWMFFVSNRILGPSVRILKELDDILSGKRQDPLGTRPGDEFFEELLKRINALIQRTR